MPGHQDYRLGEDVVAPVYEQAAGGNLVVELDASHNVVIVEPRPVTGSDQRITVTNVFVLIDALRNAVEVRTGREAEAGTSTGRGTV